MGVSPYDPTLEPYFALAEAHDVPVLIHTAGMGPYLPGFRSTAGSPLLLEEVLVRHPKLRLFVENAEYHAFPSPRRAAGAFHLGHGERFDAQATQALEAGSYFSRPPKSRHFA